MTSLTRGPLPAGVYWRRRLVLLSVAGVLVILFARLLGGGSDGSSGDDRATQVAAERTGSPSTAPQDSSSPSAPSSSRSHTPGKGHHGSGHPGHGQSTSTAPVLAEPDGPCADGDVAVTPAVEHAVAGRDVFLVLKLRTLSSEACTWRVSARTVTVKITSGRDDIWSTRECPHAVPAHDVVVRRDVTTNVGITWNARRSDEHCTKQTEWALPGFYHVAAAALAGEPSDLQFELTTPNAPVVTHTAQPHPDKGKNKPKRR
jgi:hypothetical protein